MQRPRNRTTTLAASLVAVATLAACGGSDTESGGSSDGSSGGAAAPAGGGGGEAQAIDLCYSLPLPDPTYEILLAGVTADIEGAGGAVRSANAQFDPSKQISDIQALVTQGCDVLIVGPLDPRAVRPALDQARARDVKVIIQEGSLADPELYGEVATNTFTRNEDAARDAAEYLGELVPNASVGVVTGPPVADVLVDRNNGFDAGIAAAGLTELARSDGNPQTPDVTGRQIADQWRSQYGAQMQGILSFNDETAVGLASSLQGDFRPTIVSLNASQAGVDLVRQGTVAATYSLVPAYYSHLLSYAAQEAAADRELPAVINIEMPRITEENVANCTDPAQKVTKPFTVELEDRGSDSFLTLPEDAC